MAPINYFVEESAFHLLSNYKKELINKETRLILKLQDKQLDREERQRKVKRKLNYMQTPPA